MKSEAAGRVTPVLEAPCLTIARASDLPILAFQRRRGVDMAPAARTTLPPALTLMICLLPLAPWVRTPVILLPDRMGWMTFVSSLRVKLGRFLAKGM